MLSLFTNASAIMSAGGRTIENLSVSGNTVAQQLAVWQASSQRGDSGVDCAAIHVGINDIRTGVSVATCLANMDTLRADMRLHNPNMRIVLSILLPARSNQDIATSYFTKWIPINAGFLAVASLYDAIVVGASAAFDDGAGNLAAAWDGGDHLHPNAAGNREHAKYLRLGIEDAMGLLSCCDIDHATRSAVGGWRASLGNVTNNGSSIAGGHKCPACA